MHTLFRTVLGVCFVLVTVGAAVARPPHKQALADYLGAALDKKLNDCRTCHLPDPPGAGNEADSGKPHNSFGARLAAVRKELRKAGQPTDIPSRLRAVAGEDSDGDGVANLLELLSGHFPGDAADRPTDAETAQARSRADAFLTAKEGYPWTPFEKVKRPPLPAVRAVAVRNPIDAFLAAEHEARGLTPRPEAAKPILLRRVYLDLIGLPPTPDELHAFLADPDPDAYAKVVDRLLADPRYGERWGRHWMDVWRYSDWAGWTGGNQIRDSQPHIWRWRDWIVESLNQDKGYDRMAVEMLAGDEVAPDDPDTLRATGYLVRNYKMLSRETWMQDTVEHTFQAFLGVTLRCARCHDHMFDPILQKEYYQVRAIFEPHQVRIDRIPGQPDTKIDGLARVYDAQLEVPTYRFIRGDDRNPDKSAPVPPGVPEVLGGTLALQPVNLPLAASVPDRRPFVIQELIAAREQAAAQQDRAVGAAERRWVTSLVFQPLGEPFATLTRLGVQAKAEAAYQVARLTRDAAHEDVRRHRLLAEVERFEDSGRGNTPEWERAARELNACERRWALLKARAEVMALENGLAAADPKSKVPPAKRLDDARKALAKAEAEANAPPAPQYTKRPMPTYPAASTGRRLAFARWLTDPANPLTARVAVNHIWLRHFGRALVPSVFDLGRNGRPPSHPALLDWLAAEFMESGWSMKHLHRLIVTSAAYRRASTPDDDNLRKDADNVWLWRMPSRRLEAEAVRDCVFYVAGKLDLTRGGPDIDHHQGLTVPRRSLYFRHAAEKQMEFLKLFDAASVTECYQRKESVMPQQALALINSELVLRHAELLARELSARTGDDPAAFTTAAFERVLSRPPTTAEVAECVAFLRQQTGQYTGTNSTLRARERLVHVLLNHNDFVTVR